MSIHPYLFFTNTTRAAMNRYRDILGGQLEVMSAADLPEGEEVPFEVPDDFVVHAALTFGDGDLLMASDDPTGDGGSPSSTRSGSTASACRALASVSSITVEAATGLAVAVFPHAFGPSTTTAPADASRSRSSPSTILSR